MSDKISQEILAIIGMGVLILVSLFAGSNNLSSRIDSQSTELRRTVNETDSTLRRERREDVGRLYDQIRDASRKIDEVGSKLERIHSDLRVLTESIESRLNAVEGRVAKGNDEG